MARYWRRVVAGRVDEELVLVARPASLDPEHGERSAGFPWGSTAA